MDIFEKVINKMGPLGKYYEIGDGYYLFPKLEGEMSNKMVGVLKHDELHEALQQNGLAEVSQISWDRPADQCLAVYHSMLNGAGG